MLRRYRGSLSLGVLLSLPPALVLSPLFIPSAELLAWDDSTPVKVATVEGVTEYRFPNGARAVLFPEPSRQSISVNMTVLVGSRHEGYGEAGMAHLLEHLVFKGTPTFPDVPKSLRDHGANFNGTTNSDRTNYFETLPSSDENLEFAIHLECDRLMNSFIKREDLMSEFTVVRNEFERGENSPQGVLSQRVQAVAYEWHNYGKSTIGNRSDIERVPINNLQDFYKKYYQPDNAVLIVTGNFEEAKALKLITKYLGSIPKPTRKLDAPYTEEPPQDGERFVSLKRVGAVGSVIAAYHMPSGSHPDWAPLTILGSVLSEDKVGRLDALLVESKIATSASASADNSYDPGLFTLFAQPTDGNLEVLRQKLLEIMDTVGSEPFSEEAIDRAKVRAKRRTDQLLSSATAMSSALSSAAAIGDWRLLFLQRDRIAQVTAADVNRVAQTYFPEYNRTVGVFYPTDVPKRLSIPAVESIANVVKDYKGGKAIESGEAFEPTPENIDARTKTIEIDGLKISLLPKKNRGQTVSMTMSLRYGNEESLANKTTAAGLIGGMLMAGTKKLDRQALQEQMDKIGVQISAGAGGGGRRGGRGGGGGSRAGQLAFSMEAKRESVVQGIELLGQILHEPAFPKDDFEQMKTRTISRMQSMMTEPDALSGDRLGQALSDYPRGDVRYVPSMQESLSELSRVQLDEVIEIYRRQVSGRNAEIAVVGDFEMEPVVEAIKRELLDWKSEVPFRAIERDARKELAGNKDSISTPDKANAVFMAGMSFPLNEESADSIALEIGNFILGGGTLSSRLGDRIRQKEGLSYGVSSSLSTPARGTDARFTINAITNPMNINAVETAAMEELKRFIDAGPTDAEMTDAKKAFLEAIKVSRTGDSAIASQMVSNLYLGRTFAYSKTREEQINNLTADEVRAAFKKYIDPSKLIVLRAGDFK
ncbi:MAG: M16 family metallopeptidase [Pirellula sp.]